MPLLTCPRCEQKVSVTISQAGSATTCQACSASIQVPKLGELRRLEAESLATQASSAPPPTDMAQESSGGKRMVFAFLLGLVGIGLLASGFSFIRYYAVEVPATTEQHIAEIETTYMQVPPAQLVREFQNMEKYGLAATTPYVYKKQANEKAKWARITWVCTGATVATFGLALCLGLVDSAHRRRPATSPPG